MFGVPLAGAVFGLEVQEVGRLRHEALVPALVASIVADVVVVRLGVEHLVTPELVRVGLQPLLVGKVALAGVVFGVVALMFTVVGARREVVVLTYRVGTCAPVGRRRSWWC